MKNTYQKLLVSLLIVSLATAGCATGGSNDAGSPAAAEPAQSPEPANHGRNPGGQLAGGCGLGAMEMLRLGPLGLPFTVGILAVCMPLAAVVGVASAVFPASAGNDGSGAANFTYPGGASPREQTFGGRGSTGFAYPNSYHGCYWAGCR